jgi:hypothetical protein
MYSCNLLLLGLHESNPTGSQPDGDTITFFGFLNQESRYKKNALPKFAAGFLHQYAPPNSPQNRRQYRIKPSSSGDKMAFPARQVFSLRHANPRFMKVSSNRIISWHRRRRRRLYIPWRDWDVKERLDRIPSLCSHPVMRIAVRIEACSSNLNGDAIYAFAVKLHRL